jgi:hypothetical protein
VKYMSRANHCVLKVHEQKILRNHFGSYVCSRFSVTLFNLSGGVMNRTGKIVERQ